MIVCFIFFKEISIPVEELMGSHSEEGKEDTISKLGRRTMVCITNINHIAVSVMSIILLVS